MFRPTMQLDTKIKDPTQGRLDFSVSRGVNLSSTTRHLALKFCLNGQENYHCQGQSYRVKHQHCLFLPAKTEFDYEDSRDHLTQGICMDIAEPLFHQIQPDEFSSALVEPDYLHGMIINPYSGVAAQRLLALFQTIRTQGTNTATYGEWLIEAAGIIHELSLDVTGELQQIQVKKRSTQLEIHRRLKSLATWLWESYREDITLDDMAAIGHMSKFHLIRHFRQLYACSPSQFLEQVRLKKARELLVTLHAPVSEVATMVGFRDPKYFSRRYKKRYGFSPTGV